MKVPIALAVLQFAVLVYFTSANVIKELKKREADRSYCTDGTYMKVDRCLSNCGPGFFGETSTRMCKPCVSPCRTCTESATTCTSCEEPLYLLDSTCVPDCGVVGFFSKGPARSRLRLQGGSSSFEGRVEVHHEGTWGTICDDNWSIEDAQVVCRELQLGTALEVVRAEEAGFEPASLRSPILVDDIECTGFESKVEFCSRRQWGAHNCAHFEDAGVRCSGPDISRLCVTSCGDGYYTVSNTNQCQLCAEECRTCVGSADHCLSCDYPRFLHDGQCVENCGVNLHGNIRNRMCEQCDENCLNCEDGVQNDVCTSCQDAMYLKEGKCVQSCDPKLAKNLAIRLADGTTEYEGRVEVYVDGEWGTVCDDQWDLHDAAVVCRELGYGPAIAAIKAPAFGPGIGKVMLDEVDCDGSEAEIINCRQRAWGQNDCNHHEDAGVRCQGNTALDTVWGLIVPEITEGATGKCVETCGKGYYLKDEYNCMPCSAQCLDCNNGPSQCTACKPPYFLQGGQCIEQCSIHEFGNTRSQRCKPCDKTQCERCADGETNNNCTQCAVGSFLKGSRCVAGCGPDMFLLDGTCKPECGRGFYGNPSTFVCEKCPLSCNSCAFDQSSNLVCTSCVAPKIFSNNACEDSCPAGTFSSLMNSANLSQNSTLRLVGGFDQLEGRLEVYHEKTWGTVCSDFWDIDAAHVACRELNLGHATAVIALSDERNVISGQGLIWLDNVICLGNEEVLGQCFHSAWGQQDHCTHAKDVAIRCSGPGVRQCQPTCSDGQYADPTDQSCKPCHANCLQCSNDPTYACTQCAAGTHLNVTNCVRDCGAGRYKDETDQVCSVCDERCATCVGQANRCTSCSPEYFLQGMDCVTECTDYKQLISDQVRIASDPLDPNPLVGRVEVKYNDAYGTVCDDQWSLQDAQVVCQMLGLGHALEAIVEGRTGAGYGHIVLDDVNCVGNETSLLSCQHAGMGINDCQHEEDAGVRCSGPMTSNVCISKTNCGDGSFIGGNGKACGKCSFNCKTCSGTPDTCTSCPQGQFLTSDSVCVETCDEGFFGHADGTCQACSPQCRDCTNMPAYCTSCPVGQFLDDATHTCVADCNGKFLMKGAKTIRLSGGDTPLKGRVELLHEGTWGTICDDYWDMKDADVVCRQLSLGSALNVFTNGHFGPGTGSIWMDDVECTGDERLMMQCPQHRLGAGNSDCTHQEDAGVECSGPDSSLMCVSECGEGFYPQEDQCQHCDITCLACDGTPTQCKKCRAPFYLQGTTCIAECDPGFYGNTNTRQCEPCDAKCSDCFDGPVNNLCRTCAEGFYLEGGDCVAQCSTGKVLENLLPPAPETPQVRLIGSENHFEGRVEVLHEGQWGTVCMNGWDLADAEIVCQELGLGHATSIPQSWIYIQADMTTPIWMDNLDCMGWENSIAQCPHLGWGEGNCDPRHNQDAAVVCDGSDYKRPSKNICRDEQSEPCRRDSCFSRVTCVDLPEENSACLECPEGMLGNGKNCTSISTVPPSFKATPENRTARVTFAASLSCVPEGSAPVITSENWLKNGEPLSAVDLNSGRLRVLSYGNLHFVRTRREDTAEYSCVLRNTQGSITASAFLTVQEPPQILMIQNGIVAVGDTAQLACMIGGFPVSNVSWHLNGERLVGGRYKTFNNNGTLLIDNVIIADEGSYQCVAENSLGIDHATVSLTVNEPPIITETPENITADEGHQVVLKCQASGKPQPSILWKKDGDDLPHVANNKYSQHSTGDLTINNIDKHDMGVYTCIAANPVQALTAFATILVHGPPHVLASPHNESLSTGETIIIPCEIIGAPMPKVTWEKDGAQISEGNRYKFTNKGLQINGTEAGDSGMYTCVATNEEGEVRSSAQIDVAGKIIYGTTRHVGLFASIFVVLLIIIVIVIGICIFMKRRRDSDAFSHKKLESKKDIFKTSPKKGKSDSPVMFSGNYVKISKQNDNTDTEKILGDDLNEEQL